nr:MAG TPA: hypothetical protein [Caudoviricetes sp.]
MAEGENLGGVYIEIEADVAKLLTGQQQANKALGKVRISRSFLPKLTR